MAGVVVAAVLWLWARSGGLVVVQPGLLVLEGWCVGAVHDRHAVRHVGR